MAFLIIGGITLRVVEGSASEPPRRTIGSRVYAKAGNVISTEQEVARMMNCQVDLMSSAEETALRGACPKGVGVSIDGEWPVSGGGAFTGMVDVGNAEAWMGINEEGEPIFKTVTLAIEETPTL